LVLSPPRALEEGNGRLKWGGEWRNLTGKRTGITGTSEKPVLRAIKSSAAIDSIIGHRTHRFS